MRLGREDQSDLRLFIRRMAVRQRKSWLSKKRIEIGEQLDTNGIIPTANSMLSGG